jgi:hypothetical protein
LQVADEKLLETGNGADVLEALEDELEERVGE